MPQLALEPRGVDTVAPAERANAIDIKAFGAFPLPPRPPAGWRRGVAISLLAHGAAIAALLSTPPSIGTTDDPSAIPVEIIISPASADSAPARAAAEPQAQKPAERETPTEQKTAETGEVPPAAEATTTPVADAPPTDAKALAADAVSQIANEQPASAASTDAPARAQPMTAEAAPPDASAPSEKPATEEQPKPLAATAPSPAEISAADGGETPRIDNAIEAKTPPPGDVASPDMRTPVMDLTPEASSKALTDAAVRSSEQAVIETKAEAQQPGEALSAPHQDGSPPKPAVERNANAAAVAPTIAPALSAEKPTEPSSFERQPARRDTAILPALAPSRAQPRSPRPRQFAPAKAIEPLRVAKAEVSPPSADRASEPSSASTKAAPTPGLLDAYKAEIVSRINAVKRYPEEARPRGAHGVVVVAFSIGASGVLNAASIQRSSGDEDLDQEAVATVRRAAPFPPPPPGAPHAYSAPLRYQLP